MPSATVSPKDHRRMKLLRGLYQGSDSPQDGLEQVANSLYETDPPQEAGKDPFDFCGAMIDTTNTGWERAFEALEAEGNSQEVRQAWLAGAQNDSFLDDFLAGLGHASGSGWAPPTTEAFMLAEARNSLRADNPTEAWGAVGVLG